MNTYRVDVSDSPSIVPCGMNSIKYTGDDWNRACRVFQDTQAGFDSWSRANPAYGVVLSVYCVEHRQYIVKKSKGF